MTSESGPAQTSDSALLIFELATDLCLSCHATSYGALLGPDPTNPPPETGAGNFSFLYEDNINDGPSGSQNPISGNHAGHNVASGSYGLTSDPDHTTAPGGHYPSSQLTCISCHDPHGNENYRLLGGAGPVDNSGFSFAYPAPHAEGPALGAPERLDQHVAYHSGWTNWCANCHGRFHDEGSPGFEHPASTALGSEEISSYNSYNGSIDPIGGNYATAYVPEIPLEDLLQTTSSTAGASSQSRVSCMTCHRAHATSAPSSMRWDPNVTLVAQDGIRSGSYPLPSPYTDQSQRSLCIKCHYQKSQEHGGNRVCMACHRDQQSSVFD
jgi:predicted CXXCH cytochrome family protein